MTLNSWHLLTCGLLFLCGCSSGKDTRPTPPSGEQPDALVGKWRLLRVDGKPPTEVWIKSLEIDIAADGTWKSQMEGEDFLKGMKVGGGGTWSLADGVLSCTLDGPTGAKGKDIVKSQVRIEGGHLFVDPDHFTQMRKKGPPATSEYER